MKRTGGAAALLAAVGMTVAIAVPAVAQETPHETLAKDILAELVAINTAPSGGPDLRPAVQAITKRLRNAGFPADDLDVVSSGENIVNLVVRYRSGRPTKRPLLMMAHMDVVEALRDDWTVEPYRLTEKDGWYYGRGTSDNKAGVAILVANFIRLKREGFDPNRDLIVMLTGDEETTGEGARLLTTQYRDLIDAEYALNTDAGMVITSAEGEPQAFIVQTAEKMYVSYVFEATDPGGHSSLPRADSAISRLSRVLVELEEFNFPIDLNETSRAFFRLYAPLAVPEARPLLEQLLEDPTDPGLSTELVKWPYYNALARTTCVATMLQAGHAQNALPQTARATVNCRVVPQSTAEATQEALAAIAGKEGVTVSEIFPPTPSPASPLDPAIVEPIGKVAAELWPGIPVIPEMSTGATDGLFVRNAGIPVYGVSAIAEDPGDQRAHGQDERVRAEAYYDSLEYLYRLVKVLSQD
jgi:acetylornithine deacetylase/succinyl-diaminopimelate desuccinylase-like protein